ncbi:MAG: MOSC domain-containing protein [Actinomycetia bacterium]|nr:MOSC domain-containing protein [Actinomycetes bacterium]
MGHLSREQLEGGIDHVLASPTEAGTVDLVVSRPDVDQRQVLDEGHLIVGEGLAGDNYLERGSHQTDDGKAHPEAQLNMMNSRSIDLVADGDKDLWPLAGDQLFVDFDLSAPNLAPGTRLSVGSAVLEVSAKPHTGCAKFSSRFGIDAARWVNSSDVYRFRGICAMVVQAGTIRPGDAITKLPPQD